MLGPIGALWNLLLMLIPLGIIFLIEQKFSSRKWLQFRFFQKFTFIVLILIFIAFFPNIPYIFTDSRHILDHCSGADFYKRCFEAPWTIPLFFTYGTLAIPVFVIVLEKFSRILGKIFHPVLAKITPLFFIPLAALGVCLGLFQRFNSWDLITRGWFVMESAAAYFLHWEQFLIWAVFSFCFLFIFYFFHFFFRKVDSSG